MSQPQSNNWYVLTGGPSTGKTSLIEELSKIGHKTVPEAAREHIDVSYKNGILVEELRKDERKFQEDVALIKERYESELDASENVFFDRGMHDTIAYMAYYGYPVEEWLQKIIDGSSYKKVFLLEPLEVYKKDYARTEDKRFMYEINDLLFEAYDKAGMKPVYVPVGTLEDRLAYVLANLK